MVSPRIPIPRFAKGRRGVWWGFAGIITLFVLTLIGMLAHTVLTVEDQRSDAVVIDLAGRQRMLNARHMEEILLASRGLSADYLYSRKVLHETLSALIDGGANGPLGSAKGAVNLDPITKASPLGAG